MVSSSVSEKDEDEEEEEEEGWEDEWEDETLSSSSTMTFFISWPFVDMSLPIPWAPAAVFFFCCFGVVVLIQGVEERSRR